VIDFLEAVRIAVSYIDGGEIPLEIVVSRRFSEGWYFIYQSREYLETNNPSSQLAGNAPFIVDRDTGEIQSLTTALSLDDELIAYENRKRSGIIDAP
jgi:hypothetical protein